LVKEKAHQAGFEDVSEYVLNLLLGDRRGRRGGGASNRFTREPKRDAGQDEQYTASGVWSEEMNARRCDLIDKDIQRTIRDDERQELEMLTDQFREFRRQTAPLPIEAALRLHAELLELLP
jgi:hypothetical protein